MHTLIESQKEEIVRLCRQYRVRRLAAFGSIVREDFDPKRSDADFLVEFEPGSAAQRIPDYIGLRDALSALFSRSVDLVEAGAIRNPYILEQVVQQEQVVYAA